MYTDIFKVGSFLQVFKLKFCRFFSFRSCFKYALYNACIVLELTTVTTLYLELEGAFTVKLINHKLQGPSPARVPSKALGEEGGSSVFIWSYAFVKFEN
jgi:hypothetical protein